MSVIISTSLGDIVIDLHTDHCPSTTLNFLKLCKIKYFNGCLFHTIQKDFTAQTGDPTGVGNGGDSIYKYLFGDQSRFFDDEIHQDLKHCKTGTVAMATDGENLNASQFYITLRDDLDCLDGKHTVFGEVAEGLEILTKINEADSDEYGRPYKDIRIEHTYILDDPFNDPAGLASLIPDASPEGKPSAEQRVQNKGAIFRKFKEFRDQTRVFNESSDGLKPNLHWRLEVSEDYNLLKHDTLTLHRKSCYFIGSHDDSDIELEKGSSPLHAVIVYREAEKKQPDGGLTKQLSLNIWDFGADNGTYINGNLIEPECYHELKDGYRIKFGEGNRREYHLLCEELSG